MIYVLSSKINWYDLSYFLDRLLKVPPNGNEEFWEEWVINWGFTKLLVRSDECWYWLFKKKIRVLEDDDISS